MSILKYAMSPRLLNLDEINCVPCPDAFGLIARCLGGFLGLVELNLTE